MSHGYISFGIPSDQFVNNGFLNQTNAQTGLTINGYLQFFENSLASSTIELNNADIVDFAGTSLTVAVSVNGNTVNKSATLQPDGSFSLPLSPGDFTTLGDGVASISITADYTTAPNYNTVTGGDSIIGAANTSIQAAAGNSSNLNAPGGFVRLNSPSTKSTSSDTAGSNLFRTSESSPSNVLPEFTLETIPPTVISVAATTPDGNYEEGNTIDLVVGFSEAITVTGTPQLELATGGNNRQATYLSGSGSSTLTFQYTVQAGDSSSDLDYAATTALTLAGGTIQDNAGNNATLTLPAPGATGSLGANQQIIIGSGLHEPNPDNVREVLQLLGGSGDSKRLEFSLSGLNRGNEIGFFIVDDADGKINGLSPGDAGYDSQALNNAKVLFSAIPGGIGDLTQDIAVQRTIDLPGKSFFRIFSVGNGTVDSLRSGQEGSFNVAAVSVAPTGNSEIFTLDFSDLQITTRVTDDPLPIGVNVQGDNQGEIMDLTGVSNSMMLNAVITIQREANIDSLIGFYAINDANGTVTDPLTGQPLTPGSEGYGQAILAQRLSQISLTPSNNSLEQITVQVQGGQRLAPFMVTSTNLELLLDNDIVNDPEIYTPFLGAHSDGFDHIRLLGNNTFGIEDLPFGGDQDFDDAIIHVQFI